MNWITWWPKKCTLKKKAAPSCSVHPPFSIAGEEGVEPLTKFSKKGGLTGPQLYEEGCWKRGGNFFQGGYNVSKKKNKLKSEIFNSKKSL